MENYLFKKSFQLKTFKPIIYTDLWGKKGIFSTIRIIGKQPKYLLLKNHIKKINFSLKILNIDFLLSENDLMKLVSPSLNKNKKYNHLLRVALNSKIISFSLRSCLKPYKIFNATLFNYQRPIPSLKNLYYKKIIKLLSSIDIQKKEIILFKKNFLLEGCTTNILCIHNQIIYIPEKNFYKGVTLSYLLKKTKRVCKKINISIDKLSTFDEILLVGSGKGVISLQSIDGVNWSSKSNLIHQELLKIYNQLI